MAKEINHDFTSSVSTVGVEAGKGAVGGAGLAAVGATAAVVSLAAIAAAPVVVGVLVAGAVGGTLAGIGAGLATAVGMVLAAPVLGFGATVGSVLGALKGVSKVKEEKSSFIAAERSTSVEPIMQAAQQQAYMTGVQDGQASVVQKLQEFQAVQQAAHAAHHHHETHAHHPAEQHSDKKFAEMVGHKQNSITPEAIAQQREAAANAAPSVV